MKRLQNSNSILNSYIEKAKARENLHDENERRRAESNLKTRDISSTISRGIQNARENENRNTADAFIDRNKRLLDKGIDAVKRERNRAYFS